MKCSEVLLAGKCCPFQAVCISRAWRNKRIVKFCLSCPVIGTFAIRSSSSVTELAIDSGVKGGTCGKLWPPPSIQALDWRITFRSTSTGARCFANVQSVHFHREVTYICNIAVHHLISPKKGRVGPLVRLLIIVRFILRIPPGAEGFDRLGYSM